MTTIRAINQFSQLIYKNEAQKYAQNMLSFLESKPQYSYNRYAYKIKNMQLVYLKVESCHY